MNRRIQLYMAAFIMMLLLVRSGMAQDAKKDEGQKEKQGPAEPISPEAERGPIEFGARTFWGDVYGRPDLPFKPDLATSKFNEYSDVRKNFWVRRARLNFDNLFGSDKYLRYQTQNSIYKNQSHLATFGEWGKFKIQ